MEATSAEYSSTATREHLVFAARALPENLSTVQQLMVDSLQPLFHEYIIGDLVPRVEFEARLAEEDPNTIFSETLHSTAFRYIWSFIPRVVIDFSRCRHAGLGRPLGCPSNRAAQITPDQVYDFWKRRVYNPANHTWVGVGADPKELAATLEGSEAVPPATPSVYVGGDATLALDTNTRVGIVFKGVAENDKDAPVLAVLSALTGGDAR